MKNEYMLLNKMKHIAMYNEYNNSQHALNAVCVLHGQKFRSYMVKNR